MGTEEGTVTDEPRQRKPRSTVRKAVVAVPVTIAMPFLVFWRSMRDIWRDQASRGILIMAALLLLAGTLIFRIIEDFSLLDSFYFCFITLATIGYGDLAPATDLGKMVTVVYGIAGLGVMAALISAIATQHRRIRGSKGAHGEEVANDESEQATGA
jgi:voltage-gated potassium channel